MKKYLLVAAAAVAMATPAYADCQENLDQIYEAYEKANLESEQIDKINGLLEEAEQNQLSGDEAACEKIAEEVATLLSQ